MEEFRRKTEKKKLLFGALTFIFVLLFVLSLYVNIRNGTSPHLIGCPLAAAVVCLMYYFRISRILEQEESFKKYYISETDERKLLIGKLTGNTTFLISVSILTISAVIADFFNITVALTLGIIHLHIVSDSNGLL